MTDMKHPHDNVHNSTAGGMLEQVGTMQAQGQADRRAAIEVDSAALGMLINQLAQQQAGLAEEHVLKPELVAQIADTLGRLGLDKMAHGVSVSMRRVGGMY